MTRAPAARALTAILGGWLVYVGAPTDAAGAQVAPAPGAEVRATAGVRPARVRPGAPAVVTLRITGPARPEAVWLLHPSSVSVEEMADRESTAVGPGGVPRFVFERDFRVTGSTPGPVTLDGRALVLGDTVRVTVGPLTVVGGGAAWVSPAPAPRRPGPDGPAGEGRPPTAAGRTLDAMGAWWRAGRYAPPPFRPGQGWAARADGDPWWPELVPELLAYDTWVEDPAGLIRLKAGLTPPVAWVGQQVTLVTTATVAPEARLVLDGPAALEVPRVDGAVAVDLPWAPPHSGVAGGRLQEASSFFRAYFPRTPGRLVVPPPALAASVGGGGGPPLSGPSMAVDVRPLPTGDAPPEWRGAVGRYSVRAWVDPAPGWGEPPVLTVEIRGAGYVPDLLPPAVVVEAGGGVRALTERAWVEVVDGVVGGIKRFAWWVVATGPDPVVVAPVVFAYFDPWLGGFGQVATDEIVVEGGLPVGPASGPGR